MTDTSVTNNTVNSTVNSLINVINNAPSLESIENKTDIVSNLFDQLVEHC